MTAPKLMTDGDRFRRVALRGNLPILLACGSAPVVEPDAEAPDASEPDAKPEAAADSAPEAAPTKDAGVDAPPPPVDAGWSDPNCVTATGCDWKTSLCATGWTNAYADWAYACGNTNPDKSVVRCDLPDWNRPPCSDAGAGGNLHNGVYIYWCCP